MLSLDTHVVVFAIENRLNSDERRLLGSDFWSISDVVLWEIGMLSRAGRIRITLDDSELSRMLDRITVWPITRNIAKAAGRLDFRGDPADEIIAATSIVHDIPLLTRDARILNSKVVPLAIR
jgi:PIN domain nuclease of toxin-antitoxin system